MPRINCDMNAAHRALSQFLVTDDFKVVLNDLDDVPLANGKNRCEWGLSNVIEKINMKNGNSTTFDSEEVKVEENDLTENFLAPEQLMTDQQFFNFYQTSTRYDTEKIDIWKIPDLIIFMLSKNIAKLIANGTSSKSFKTTLKSSVTKNCDKARCAAFMSQFIRGIELGPD